SRRARARSAHELGGRAVDLAVDDGEAVIAGNGAQPAAARWGSSAVFDPTMAGTVVTVLSFGPSCDTESVIRPVVITTRDPALCAPTMSACQYPRRSACGVALVCVQAVTGDHTDASR